MNNYVNPPSISSIAMSIIIRDNDYNGRREEVGITSPFGGSVSSDE